MVGVRTGITTIEVALFGSVKQSDLGSEGAHHGIEDFLMFKYIYNFVIYFLLIGASCSASTKMVT
jgi:acyl-CoA reductase-like NAD-dependent aldehyde dehydrogenase